MHRSRRMHLEIVTVPEGTKSPRGGQLEKGEFMYAKPLI
jgi:hypothetical protein